MDVLIIGAGIGGLTLALALHQRGIPARIYEAASRVQPIGAGLNVLPHAVAELAKLGIADTLGRHAIATKESAFFNRFGQLIYREPAGCFAGYEFPQLSIHRGDLQTVLLEAAIARLGSDRIHLGWRCIGAEQDGTQVTARFETDSREQHPAQRGAALIACDGIHSVIRKQLNPDEGEPIYSGVNMWRGVIAAPPFLSGASMVRVGWLTCGKLVIYPVRDNVDGTGKQLINWVAEIETPNYRRWDWNRPGRLEDFIDAFADWHFDWLDVPALLRATDPVLEFPMVDRDPLPRWGVGRLTLLGDAAHPMYPRGSNGAVQAILDARALADALSADTDTAAALAAYEHGRRPTTTQVVLRNRTQPPDAILREVYLRTGDRPFQAIDDVISAEELAQISNSYKGVSGYMKNAR